MNEEQKKAWRTYMEWRYSPEYDLHWPTVARMQSNPDTRSKYLLTKKPRTNTQQEEQQ